MVKALLLDLAPEPQPGEPPHPPGFKEGIMVWIGEDGNAHDGILVWIGEDGNAHDCTVWIGEVGR